MSATIESRPPSTASTSAAAHLPIGAALQQAARNGWDYDPSTATPGSVCPPQRLSDYLGFAIDLIEEINKTIKNAFPDVASYNDLTITNVYPDEGEMLSLFDRVYRRVEEPAFVQLAPPSVTAQKCFEDLLAKKMSRPIGSNTMHYLRSKMIACFAEHVTGQKPGAEVKSVLTPQT